MWSYYQKISQKNLIIFSKKIQKNIDNIPQKCDLIPTQGEEVDCPSAVQGSKLWVDCWQWGGIFGEHHHCFCHHRDDHDCDDDRDDYDDYDDYDTDSNCGKMLDAGGNITL